MYCILDLLSLPQSGGKMSKLLGRIIGCKDKTSSWPLNGFPDDGSNISSTTVGRSPSLYCTLQRKISTHLDLLSIQRIGCPPEKTINNLYGGSQSRSWSAEQGNIYRVCMREKWRKLHFSCPRSRQRISSRATGPAVPSRVSLLLIPHTQD